VLESGTNEIMRHRLGDHAEPYKTGQPAVFTNVTRACITAGALLAATRAGSSRPAAVAAGALLSLGALSARWTVFRAGFQGVADPQYVVGPQRTAVERGQRTGGSRREPRVSQPDPKLGSPATALSSGLSSSR
jgi:hypothetical protein